MRKFSCLLLFSVLWALQGFAQEHYSEGPVWNVTFIRVKPAQFDAYLTNLQQNAKVAYDEAKRQGGDLGLQGLSQADQKQPTGLGYCPGGSLQELRPIGRPSGEVRGDPRQSPRR